MQAVFLDKQTFSSSISIEHINQQVDKLTCYQLTTAEEVVERCIDADIIITNKVVLTKQLLKQLPKLQLICIAATGVNNVDINAAKSLNIAVTNVSGYAKNSVAQYVFAQILAYFSQVEHHNNNVEQGLWQENSTFCYHGNGSVELANKTIGLIGYGDLAKSVEKIALAFGMKILVAERPSAIKIRTGRTQFNDVIKHSDILSLHCPQTPETENLINKDVFLNMKNNAVLINTARGALVNEDDLKSALESHQIAYAILDVLKQEPPKEKHLLLSPQPKNLKVTAHIAWASIESQQRLLNLLAKNIADYSSNIMTNRVDR